MCTRMIRRSCGVDLAHREPVLLEPGDDAGHARRLHLLDRGELAEGDRPDVVDGGERGETGRGEVVARAQRLLAHPAGEPGVGEAQPGGQHFRGDLRAWKGRRGWSRRLFYQTN